MTASPSNNGKVIADGDDDDIRNAPGAMQGQGHSDGMTMIIGKSDDASKNKHWP
eukprot:CAMPEP_0119561220 /NCGR_PEP_ID=MMETSP1352-20130426/17022_1 /TAXON_ID=265584 /ORGANISM="Stauroneis constricta, Strain CCMP1120" /LENGTH=53 /DNA_ID=CAMNT_0007609383 /DNA_START=61 /DNA_END=219 /DNA_ORIENTATION=+